MNFLFSPLGFVLIFIATFISFFVVLKKLQKQQYKTAVVTALISLIVMGGIIGLYLTTGVELRSEVNAPIGLPAPTPTPDIPSFDWPPPQASAMAPINPKFLKNSTGTTHLNDVSEKIAKALDAGGYTEKCWYSIPNGFALVTRIEQFNKDGTPAYGQYRWVDDQIAPEEITSVWDYLRSLFVAKPGHYRVIVFMVTNASFPQGYESTTREEARAWLSHGVQNGLPKSIGDLEFTDDYKCTGLIYEFVKNPDDEAASFAFSSLTGQEHLQKCKVWDTLSK